jgi:hypothetical protein
MIKGQTFLNEQAFIAYKDYLAIKRHFISSYDYFKYNGKVNVSLDSFMFRKDTYLFQKLSKKRDYKNLILSNIVLNSKLWIGSLLEETANEVYLEWKKRTDAITHHVQESLQKLDTNFRTNFVSIQGQYPHIIDLYMQKEISLETLTILTKLTNSSKYWEKTVVDKVVFPNIINKLNKYEPFLAYSPDKVKKIIKSNFF